MEELTLEELEKIFADPDDTSSESDAPGPGTPPAATPEPTKNKEDSVERTKAFAKRLAEATEKARLEEREALAKAEGYASYSDMIKKREEKIIKDKGFEPEEVAPIVDELVNKRLENDPRLKELELLKQKQAEEFGKQQLSEITKLTGGEITDMSQLPKEVIEDWKRTGNLKQSFLSIKGEEYLLKARAASSKGSTSHLYNPPTPAPQISYTERPLTSDERAAWKLFHPSLTDAELDKKTIKVKS